MRRLLFMLTIVALVAGCGSGQKDNSEAGVKKMDAQQWANEVAAICEYSLDKLDELVGHKPELTPELIQSVADLKEEVIQKLVMLGRVRENMDDAEKSSADLKLSLKTSRIGKKPQWENTMVRAREHYAKLDPDFTSVITSFNVISQYAYFNLLREQEPADAARLGL